MLAFDIVGELFLGKSFGALDSDEPPAYIEDIDRYFVAMGMKSSFPWFFKIVSYFPLKRWQFMLGAPHRLIEYGHAAFEEYVAAHGRDPRFSKRKDLLTKMIVPLPKSTTDASLTDEEISTEIGNL
ncbi:hypothetical protein LTR28_002445, partial [Elasticomyces elasticus]